MNNNNKTDMVRLYIEKYGDLLWNRRVLYIYFKAISLDGVWNTHTLRFNWISVVKTIL